MNRRFKLFAAAVGVCVIAFAAVNLYLDHEKTDITFLPATGNEIPEAADGLTVMRDMGYLGRLQWENEITFEKGRCITASRCSYLGGKEKNEEEADSPFAGVRLMLDDLEGESAVSDLKQYVDRAKVPYAEFRKYYDLEISLYDTDGNLVKYDDMQDSVKNKLSAFFRLPVDEDAVCSYHDGIWSVEGREPELKDLILNGKHYLLSGWTNEYAWGKETGIHWETVSDAHILKKMKNAGGYGLYMYELEGDRLKLENVFAPENDGIMEGIYETGDPAEILIMVYEGEELIGYILNVKNHTVKQKISAGEAGLMSLQADDYYEYDGCVVKQDGEYLWLLTDHEIIILEKKNGTYEKVLEYAYEEDPGIFMDDTLAVSFDGVKGAIAALPAEKEGRATYECGWSYGFQLLLLDRSGIIYEEFFAPGSENSLNHEPGTGEDYRFQGILKAEWRGGSE